MKKKFILFIGIIGLISCGPSDSSYKKTDRDYMVENFPKDREITIPKEDLEKAQFKAAVDPNSVGFCDIVEFEYKGHKYIWFAKSKCGRLDSRQGYGFAGVVHDPTCPCLHGNNKSE